MTYILGAGLILGLAIAAPAATIDHSARLDHHSGPVDTRYRGSVSVNHKQVGAVAPGGRPSTLRCMWSADMTVDRHATTAAGTLMTRRISREGVVSGNRSGWCDTNKASIAKEVAVRMQTMNHHLTAVAQEDHEYLRLELDQLHGPTRTG